MNEWTAPDFAIPSSNFLYRYLLFQPSTRCRFSKTVKPWFIYWEQLFFPSSLSVGFLCYNMCVWVRVTPARVGWLIVVIGLHGVSLSLWGTWGYVGELVTLYCSLWLYEERGRKKNKRRSLCRVDNRATP